MEEAREIESEEEGEGGSRQKPERPGTNQRKAATSAVQNRLKATFKQYPPLKRKIAIALRRREDG